MASSPQSGCAVDVGVGVVIVVSVSVNADVDVDVDVDVEVDATILICPIVENNYNETNFHSLAK